MPGTYHGPEDSEFSGPRSRYGVSEVEFLTPDLRALKSYGRASVTLRGNDALTGIRAVVVMAHVFNQGKGALSFAYPPVEIADDVDFDGLLDRGRRYFILRALVLVVCSAGLIFQAVLWLSKRRNQQNLESDVAQNGINMR